MTTAFKYNPDLDVDGAGRTNSERTEAAVAALNEYNGDEEETAPQDLISDLGHYCDSKDIDFESLLSSAVMNWMADREE